MDTIANKPDRTSLSHSEMGRGEVASRTSIDLQRMRSFMVLVYCMVLMSLVGMQSALAATTFKIGWNSNTLYSVNGSVAFTDVAGGAGGITEIVNTQGYPSSSYFNGSAVTLPETGYYRMDISFTWAAIQNHAFLFYLNGVNPGIPAPWGYIWSTIAPSGSATIPWVFYGTAGSTVQFASQVCSGCVPTGQSWDYTPALTLELLPATATNSTLSCTPTTTPVGSTSTCTVTGLSAYGTPAPGVFALTSAPGSTLSTNTCTTTSAVNTCNFTVTSATDGTYAVSAQIDATEIVNSPTNITFRDFNYWDGNAGPADNSVVNGGVGTWDAFTANWTNFNGIQNAPWDVGQVAHFQGTAATVTLAAGYVPSVSGIQFDTTGYIVTGPAGTSIAGTLAATPLTVNVGTDTISAILSGTAIGYEKLGVGTLVVGGVNTYTGPTKITAGTLSVNNVTAAQARLGASPVANVNNLVLGGGTLQYTGAAAQTMNRAFTIAAGTTGSIDVSNAAAVMTASGASAATNGNLTKLGAGVLSFTGAQAYTGLTTISAGTLRLAGAGNLNSTAGVLNNSVFQINRTAPYTFTPPISGTGSLGIGATGLITLTGTHTYTGPTSLTGTGGILQIGGAGSLGAGNYAGTITMANTVPAETFQYSSSVNQILSGIISGPGNLTKDTSATSVLTLSGANTYTGITTVNAGTLSVASIGNGGVAGNLGAATNAATNLVLGGGTLQYTGATAATDRNLTLTAATTSSIDVNNVASNLTLAGASVATTGALTKTGAGTLTLAGANLHTGLTTVAAGSLLVNGSTSTGGVLVNAGATLGGTGTVGGATVIDGTLAPGAAGAGTLAFASTLTLNAGAISAFELGAPNSTPNALNDLVNVTGSLTLGGTLTLAQSAGGNFTVGTYRLFNHPGVTPAGSFSNGANVGVANGCPAIFICSVDVSIPNQVNLVVVAPGNYWDGDAGPANNGVVNGGVGTWNAANTNWTQPDGSVNGPWIGGNNTAFFQGTAGTVTLAAGYTPSIGGLTFDVTGYTITGGTALAGANATNVLTVTNAADIATILTPLSASPLSNGYDKQGAGTLVLGDPLVSSVSTYAGATSVSAGTLKLSSNTGLGAPPVLPNTSGISIAAGATLYLSEGDLNNVAAYPYPISGAGTLVMDAYGDLQNIGNSYSGQTILTGGTAGRSTLLRLSNGAAGLGNTSAIVSQANYAAANFASTIWLTQNSNYTFNIPISGELNWDIYGTGTTTFQGANSSLGYFNVQEALVRAAANNALGANPEIYIGGGTGATLTIGAGFSQVANSLQDSGNAVLTVEAGASLNYIAPWVGFGGIDGVFALQNATTTLNGTGTVDWSGFAGGGMGFTNGAHLAPGINGTGPLTLKVSAANAVDISGANFDMQLGAANVVGGALNDLLEVTGNLVLTGGTLNLSQSVGGSFVAGTYRLINYTGTRTGTFGTVTGCPVGFTCVVNTATAGQVNLVVAAPSALNYWDGVNTTANNIVDGGTSTWDAATSNWTLSDGSANGIWPSGAVGIFQGTAGTVTVSGTQNIGGLTFNVTGYTITGGTGLNGTSPSNVLTAAPAVTATIATPLSGTNAFDKQGTGTVILTGSHPYSAATPVTAGTLQIGSEPTLGGVPNTTGVAVAAGATLAFQQQNLLTYVFPQVISGAGGLSVLSTTTLNTNNGIILTSDSTYSGPTILEGGNHGNCSNGAYRGTVLQLGNGGTSGSINNTSGVTGASSSNIGCLPSLYFNRSDAQTIAYPFSGNMTIQQIGTGVTTLTNSNTFSGEVYASSGELVAASSSAFGALTTWNPWGGKMTVAAGTTHQAAYISTWNGLLELGAGSVVTAMLIPALGWDGADIYAAGSILSGNGTLDWSTAVTDGIGFTGGGHAAPGIGGAGTLTLKVAPGFAVNFAGGVADMELGPDGTVGGGVNDLIAITGDLTLGGTSTLNVSALGGFNNNGSYTLITYTGARIGVFTTVNLPPGYNGFIDYSVAGQVRLVVAPKLRISKISNGGVGTFDFSMYGLSAGNVSLTTTVAGTPVTSAVYLGTMGVAVGITETSPNGWPANPVSVSCIDANGATNGNGVASLGSTAGNQHTIPAANMVAGADITCTFTNGQNNLSGKVFNDGGAPVAGVNSGIPNDGLQNGSEAGLSGVTVNLTNCGVTTYSTATTDGSGAYTLNIPVAQQGSTVCVAVSVPGSHLATGANASGTVTPNAVPTTVGGIAYTYTRASQQTSFVAPAGGAMVLNFGQVPLSVLATNSNKTGQAGTNVVHNHTFTAGSGGTLSINTGVATASPAMGGWSELVYLDTGCTGTVQAGATKLYPPQVSVTVTQGEVVCFVVQQFIPMGATNGNSNSVPVNAALTFTNASPALSASYQITDVTSVSSAAVQIQKEVRNVTQGGAFGVSNQAKSGDTLEYRITYTNISSAPVNTLVIGDVVVSYTTFAAASAGTLPAALSSCTKNTPANPIPAAPVACNAVQAAGGTGGVSWQFGGVLNPGASSTVTYSVVVD